MNGLVNGMLHVVLVGSEKCVGALAVGLAISARLSERPLMVLLSGVWSLDLSAITLTTCWFIS